MKVLCSDSSANRIFLPLEKQSSAAWATLAAMALLCAGTVSAATMTWTGGPSGTGTNWDDAANWGGTKPGSGDAAQFSATGLGSGGKVISLTAPQTVNQIVISASGAGGTFTIGDTNDVAVGHTLTVSTVTRTSTGGGTHTIAANVAMATNGTWDISAGFNDFPAVIVSGTISGLGYGLNKWNTGTLSLRGSNSYSGATAVNLGTLNLNFTATGSPVSNIVNPVSDLKMNGGAVTLNGKGSAPFNSQTFNGLTLNNGASSFSIAAGASSNSTRLALQGITRMPGATINFNQPTVNTSVNSSNGYMTTAGNDASGILGAYATISGTNWAANNGTNIVAYFGYTTLSGGSPTISDGPTSNVRVSSASSGDVGQAAGTVTINTLLVNDPTARTLAIGAGNALRLGAIGGILVPGGAGALTIGAPGNAGTLTAGGAPDVAGELIVNNATDVTVNATLADNGAGAVLLTKAGAGRLTLAGAATYTGGTTLNAGSLFLPAGTDVLSPSAPLTVNGGTLNLNGSSQNVAAAVIFRGGTTTNGTLVKSGSSFDAKNGTVYATLGGAVGLDKTTPGTLYLAGANTYTGDTTVREGSLVAGSGSSGTIAVRGNLIVGSANGGAASATTSGGTPFTQNKSFTVYGSAALSFGGAAQYLAGPLNLVGGSFTGTQPYFQIGAAVYMTGGILGGNIYGNGDFAITSYSNVTPALVTATLRNNHAFNVADGPAPVDLRFSGSAMNQKTLTKIGPGLVVQGTVQYGSNTVQLLVPTADGGTLVVR